MAESYHEFKEKGNEAFRAKNYKEASNFYTKAIQVKDDEPIAYSNRAMCNIQLGKYYEAKGDCDRAIQLDPKFVKAYYRRATALSKLFRYRLSRNDYQTVLSLDPSNTIVKREIDNIDKILDSDTRIDLRTFNKPKQYQSKRPVVEFELWNRHSGTISPYDHQNLQ